MSVVTYVAPVGSDGREVTRWAWKVNRFEVGVPIAHAAFLSPFDLPALIVEGGLPMHTEYLFGLSFNIRSLKECKVRFALEESI